MSGNLPVERRERGFLLPQHTGENLGSNYTDFPRFIELLNFRAEQENLPLELIPDAYQGIGESIKFTRFEDFVARVGDQPLPQLEPYILFLTHLAEHRKLHYSDIIQWKEDNSALVWQWFEEKTSCTKLSGCTPWIPFIHATISRFPDRVGIWMKEKADEIISKHEQKKQNIYEALFPWKTILAHLASFNNVTDIVPFLDRWFLPLSFDELSQWRELTPFLLFKDETDQYISLCQWFIQNAQSYSLEELIGWQDVLMQNVPLYELSELALWFNEKVENGSTKNDPVDSDILAQWLPLQDHFEYMLEGVFQHPYVLNETNERLLPTDVAQFLSEATLNEAVEALQEYEARNGFFQFETHDDLSLQKADIKLCFVREIGQALSAENLQNCEEHYQMLAHVIDKFTPAELKIFRRIIASHGFLDPRVLRMLDGDAFSVEAVKTEGRIFLHREEAGPVQLINVLSPQGFAAWKKAAELNIPVAPIRGDRPFGDDICVDSEFRGQSLKRLAADINQHYFYQNKFHTTLYRQKDSIRAKLAEANIQYESEEVFNHDNDRNYVFELIERKYFEAHGGWTRINEIPYDLEYFSQDLATLDEFPTYDPETSP